MTYYFINNKTHCLRLNSWNITPYNVGSVLWRLFSTLKVVQYIGGITSVLWGDSISTVGDSFSTVEAAQYSGG